MIGIDVPGPVIAGFYAPLESHHSIFFRKAVYLQMSASMNPKKKPQRLMSIDGCHAVFVKNHGAWRWASRLSMFLCGPLLYEVLVM